MACGAVGFLAAPALALDPQKLITQFVHTAWTEKDGAPPDIRALAQTTDGYLWLGTAQGLFRFDGVRFTRFEPQGGEGFNETRVPGLLATRDGSLWIVAPGGAVSRLLNGHVTSYSERQGLAPTFSLAEGDDGVLIAGTAKGLFRFKDGGWEDVGKGWNFPASRATRVFFDKSGVLWVVTDDRVLYLPEGGRSFVDPGQPTGEALNFAEAPDGSIWIPDVERSAHTVQRLGDASPVTELRVGATAVVFDRDGSLWISSIGDGLRRVAYPERIRGHRIAQFGLEAEQLTARDGLSGAVVYCGLEDREGDIWWGTATGLDRFRESAFIPVPIASPDAPRAVVATREGSIWTFSPTGSHGLLRISPRGGQQLFAPWPGDVTNAMYEDEFGVVWSVGADGLFRRQQDHFVRIPLPAEAFGQDLVGITGDRAGGIWLFDQGKGLFRFADGGLTKVAGPGPTSGYAVLYADRSGRVWKSQYQRISRYDRGTLQDFGGNEGVPPGFVLAFHEDRDGSLWASGDGGLSKFENGRFRTLSTSNGFPARSVYGIAEDDDGHWWLATDIGVLRVAAQDLASAIADPAHRIHYKSFDTLDGLPGKPRASFPVPILSRAADGRIWIATSNGIAYVDPRRIPKNDLPPPVIVETVKLDGKEVAPADGMALAHGTNYIEIDYTALCLSIPERVQFRYKLEGRDNEWHEAGTVRRADYSGLAPKSYRFRVIACNNDGVWNEVGAAWSFSITPAWYQTSFFSLLCIAAGLAILWAIYRLRVRQVSRALAVRFDERLAERLAERTRIARELHDTLLQTIQGSKLVAEAALEKSVDAPAPVRLALEKLSKWLGQATQEGRAALNSLRASTIETNDLAASLRQAAEECVSDKSMAVKFSVLGDARDMHPIVRDEIYRIGYEAIRNACEHSRASQLEVELRYGQDLRLRVTDNGIGIEPSVVTGGREGHFGLQGMRERAERIGSKLTLVSSRDSGTEVTLVVLGKTIFRRPSATRFGKIKTFFKRVVVTDDRD